MTELQDLTAERLAELDALAELAEIKGTNHHNANLLRACDPDTVRALVRMAMACLDHEAKMNSGAEEDGE